MKKDKLWAKIKVREELESWRGVEGGIDEDGVNYVLNIIDQLIEPEVLSQEWIDKNVVHVRGLGDIVQAEAVEGLLVPNQEITYEDAIKVIAENIDTDEFSVGLYIEALNNNGKYEFLTDKWIDEYAQGDYDEWVYTEDLQNLIVPKRELPVIPKYVAEFIGEVKASGDRLDDVFSNLRDIYYQSKTADWIAKENRNSETFARAWLYGYEVEEEPLYYALVKGHELLDNTAKYWAHNKYDLEDLFISYETRDDSPIVVKNTKNHWDDLGINDSNADFIEVGEV